MKRKSLFAIGLISAIATIIILNFAFGGPWNYYNRYPYFRAYHRCYNYRDENNYQQRRQQQKQSLQNDSSTVQY